MLCEVVSTSRLGNYLLHGGGCTLAMVIGVSAKYLAAVILIVGELRLSQEEEPNSSLDMSGLEAQ